MTNHWIDLKNSDCIMIMGSNAAENHPISFKWVTRAMENGATMICVDPRYTRTASKADIYAPLRPGTDIAFLNGMIRYCIENGLYNDEYLRLHTNALCKINAGLQLPEDLDGLFSGFDPATKKYSKSTWQYQLDAGNNNIKADDLDDPECVFAILRRHVSRYTPEVVADICGVSVDKFLEVTQAFCATGARDKVGTIMYAMGWTQHSKGVQNIRSMAILQLLLGNIGLAGGGVNALRGESNVQGSTDFALLYHILPGYLPCPTSSQQDLDTWVASKALPTINPGKSTNYWQNTKKFAVSLLKDYFGEHATAENDFAYHYLPKRYGDHSHIPLFRKIDAGVIKGLIAFGQNPAVGGPDAEFERDALAKLDWLIVAELWETETAAFWKRDGVNPRDIKTEVFLLPAAASFEKEGSISNSGRWMQWRYKAVEPPGEARSDLWILGKLGEMLKLLYRGSRLERDKPIQHLSWDYSNTREDEVAEDGFNVHEVIRRINGYFLEDVEIDGKLYEKGTLVPSFPSLQDNGTTSSASWIYCGCYTESGGNLGARRNPDNSKDVSGIGLYSSWSWCWPVNRRIIYNRASCDVDGNPWNESKKVIWWDGAAWQGGDVRDFGTSAPSAGVGAFIMTTEGIGKLFGAGLADGPLPEHYEPVESPIPGSANPIGHGQRINPVLTILPEPIDNTQYPYVCTTYRMVEHWQAGAMTRNLPWLAELVPDAFAEISETLATKIGVVTGEKVRIWNPRGSVTVYALVTNRIKKFNITGREVEMIGLPWHFGYQGLVKGDSANSLTPQAADPNTSIPEFKAFLVNIEKA
jgi:formate dehydrogenase major subunit